MASTTNEATKEVQTSNTPADIYGQVHPVETTELIAAKQKEFETELEKIPKDKKTNLLQAQKKCPQLLTDDFKLMFLRCEVFNADLAAKRYAQYWDKRVEIFGSEKAFQPLTLNNGGALSNDTVALEMGFITVTGSTDTSGRSILLIDPSKLDKTKCERESMCRAFWYCLHAALESEDAQKCGVVVLGYPHHAKLSQFDRPLVKMNVESIKSCIPVRLSAFHLCHPPAFFTIVFPIIKLFLGERLRKRVQIHAGSREHVVNHLGKFGLERQAIPSDIGGDLVLDRHGWLENRRAAGL